MGQIRSGRPVSVGRLRRQQSAPATAALRHRKRLASSRNHSLALSYFAQGFGFLLSPVPPPQTRQSSLVGN